MAGHGEHREWKNSKQETDQAVLTITKALAKTTKFTCRAKKVNRHDKKNKEPYESLPTYKFGKMAIKNLHKKNRRGTKKFYVNFHPKGMLISFRLFRPISHG